MPTINGVSPQKGPTEAPRRTAPQPDDARTPAAFLAVMRDLQRWSGLSVEELETRTAHAPVLLPGGLAGMLGGDALPRRELVSAFISACGCVPEVQAEWIRAYERVATGNADPPRPVDKPAVLEPPVPASPEKAQPEEQPGEQPKEQAKQQPKQQPKQHRARHRKPSRTSGAFRAVSAPMTSASGAPSPDTPPDTPPGTPPGPAPRRAPGAGPGASPKGGGPRGRRSLAPLVAAPAFVTAGVIALAMLSGLGGGDGGEKKPQPEKSRAGEPSAAVPPSTGWYSIQPETAEQVGNCLTILPDDQFEPTLSQDKCDEQDHQQRFRVETRPDGSYTFKAYTNENEFWCLTLDAPTEGARLHLNECEDSNRWQRFHVEGAKPQSGAAVDDVTSEPAPLFDLKAGETRGDEMCVGIDPDHPGSVQAVHTSCAKSAIWGYSFVQTSPVNGL